MCYFPYKSKRARLAISGYLRVTFFSQIEANVNLVFSPYTKISPVKESRTSSTGDPDPCDVLTSELLRTYSESTSFVLQFFSDVLLMPYVRSADTTAPGGFSTNSYKNLNQFLDSAYSEGYLETVICFIVFVKENCRFTYKVSL